MSTVARYSLERSACWALLRKELAESRSALLAGALIFMGLPILWTFLYAAMDRNHEVFPGMASALLALAGWLFSAVIAAQSIGRDFGRRQGDFLRARPITVAHILWAKTTVSFGLVLALLAAVGLLELPLAALAPDKPVGDAATWRVWLYAMAACVVAYWVALAGAALTRQMLSGVMLAALVLALLLTVPFISSVPSTIGDWLEARFRAQDSSSELLRHAVMQLWVIAVAAGVLAIVLLWIVARRGTPRVAVPLLMYGAVFVAVVYAVLRGMWWPALGLTLLAVSAAVLGRIVRWACSSEAVWRLGTKSVAWVIGLTLILLCTLAMNEVGTNLPVTGTYWYRDAADSSNAAWAIGRARIGAARSDSLVLYDISPDGQISQHLSDVQLRAACSEAHPGPWAPVLVFDPEDELFVLLTCVSGGSASQQAGDSSRYSRFFLARIDWESDSVDRLYELELPELIPAGAQTYAYDAIIESAHLFVLYCHWPRLVGERYHGSVSVAAYEWQDGPGRLVDARRVGPGWIPGVRDGAHRLRRGADGRLQALAVSGGVDQAAPDGEPWKRTGLLGSQPVLDVEGDSLIMLATRLRIADGVFAVSEWSRFGVAGTVSASSGGGIRGPEVLRLVGQVRASPWGLLFRTDFPILLPARSGQVWEVHEAGALCYDVSVPQRPRKLCHVMTHPVEDARSGPEYLLLVYKTGLAVVRHPAIVKPRGGE